MWKKKKIKNAFMFGLPVTIVLGGVTFNQGLKHEYGIPPHPPQIRVEPINPIMEEIPGASGLSGIGLTGMLGGEYYGSEYYGGSDKTKGIIWFIETPAKSSTSKMTNGAG